MSDVSGDYLSDVNKSQSKTCDKCFNYLEPYCIGFNLKGPFRVDIRLSRDSCTAYSKNQLHVIMEK